MTITSQKDLLFSTFQEFDIAQQTVDRTRSQMHCIIAALPNEESQQTIPLPLQSYRNRPTLEKCLITGSEKQTSCPSLKNNGNSQKSRPVVMHETAQTDIPDSKLVSRPTSENTKSAADVKPKQVRAKRVSESDIRKAVKLVYDENMTQREAEKACNLPPGTLSRRKGKQIMTQYRQDWGTPTMIDSQHGVSRKELEKALRYGDDR